MLKQKLNPQKPGISQPQQQPQKSEPARSEPSTKGSDAPKRKGGGVDKSKQVPIEGE